MAKAMAAAGLLTVLSLMANGARADELSDMKVMLKQLQERVDQMEAKAAAPAPNTVAAATTPMQAGTGPAVASNRGFNWKLYGRGDIGYTVSQGKDVNGRENTTRRLNQGEMASRLGISGDWVFNDEYKALFGLETGINLFNGNSGGGTQNNTNSSVLFNRGATAGLATKTWGSIEGGTMYMAPFWVSLGADQASAHNYGANDFSALFSLTRPEALGRYLKDPVTNNFSKTSTLAGNNSGTALFYANSLRYRSPTYKNLSAEVTFSNGQQASGATPLREDGRTVAANVLYKKDNLFLGYAHMNYVQSNDINSNVSANFQTRNQVTDIVGARYKWDDLILGGSYTSYRVSNAGGYNAKAFGVSGAYEFGKQRVELSLARITYGGANASGAYGTNLGDGIGNPTSNAFGLGYLYNLQPNLSFYAYATKVQNNAHAKLGVLQFRGDNNFFGYSPIEFTTGMFLVF
jgi:predicted porin